MPVISRFLGIVIAMYWNDHSPPHFHARYAGREIKVFLSDGSVEGDFPKRALRLVLEWYSLHKDELSMNWQLCERKENPRPVEPLE